MKSLPALEEFDDLELLQLWAKVMHELRERRVIRSANSPIGDYCELLVATRFGVELAGPSARYDLRTKDGARVEVKGRRFTSLSTPSHFSMIRNLDAREFDVLTALLLNEDFTVREAWSLTWDAVKRHAKYVPHVNGWRLPLVRGALLDDPDIDPFEL